MTQDQWTPKPPVALFGTCALACLALGATVFAQSMPLENLAHFPRGTLTISARGRIHRFKVWIANTPSRQEQGLMFVRDLPPDQGMIFPQQPPQPVQFWMENTYVPLDMLFVDPDGRIGKIIANATPFSERLLPSDGPVEAVIEIAGGEAEKLGLAVGARVRWQINRPGG